MNPEHRSLRGLRDEWFPLVQSAHVSRRPVPVQLLAEPFVVVGTAERAVHVIPTRAWARRRRHNDAEVASELPVEERHGIVWSCLGRPPTAAPEWPYAEWPGIAGSADIACNFVRIVENMMDATHAAFVHGGLLRARPSKLVTYWVRECDTGVTKVNRGENARGSLLYWLFGNGESQFSHVEEFIAPNWVRAEYRTMQGQVVFAAQFALTPTTWRHTRVFYRVSSPTAFRRGPLIDVAAKYILNRLVRRVIAQDRWILEAEEQAGGPLAERPRRAATVADIASQWARRRAVDYACGRRGAYPQSNRSVEFELRL